MTAETEAPDPTTSLLAFFGSELRRVRTEAGLSQGQAAKKALTTQAMISYVEAAKRVPTEDLVKALDNAFQTGGHFARLYPLVIRYAYPSWFLPYVELEREAVTVRTFQCQVVHGLLQTEAYARAMLSALRPDNLDALVAARITRQEMFERATPPRTWFVMDEHALMRHIGGKDVMRAQLAHLLKVGESPRTVIQVIPRGKPEHPGLSGSFALLTFDEGPDVLHVDGFSRGRTTAEPEEVTEASHAYDLLRAVALSPDASAELIGTHLRGLSA